MGHNIIAGVDVGGTFIKFGFFDESGRMLDKWQIATGEHTFEVVMKRIACQIEERAAACGCLGGQMIGVGMGVPGSVNRDGILISAPNLGWKNLNVAHAMKEYFDVPVFVGNDANVAALGEQYFGAGEGCDSMVMVTLGTGVGGGVIVNQQLVAGAFGGAGEIGHMVINDRETVACTCGNKGCLEQYASASGIARMAKQQLSAGCLQEQSSLQKFDPETITAKEVFDAVKEGDALAVRVAETFGEMLGRALGLVSCVADPELFVIGGGVCAAGDVLLSYIEKYYRKYAFAPSRQARFALAVLGNDAGICGAARMVMLANR